MESEQGARRGIHRLEVEHRRIREHMPAQQRVAGDGCVTDAVLVSSPDGREPRIEPLWREHGREHDHVAREPGDAVEPAGERLGPALAAALVERGELRRAEVEVGHLAGRVNAGVGASGDGEAWRRAVPLEHRGDRRL